MFATGNQIRALCCLASMAGISLTLSGAALANPGLDRWGGVVFFCGSPTPAQDWGEEACEFLAKEAAKQAQALNVPLVSVPPERAGITGGPVGEDPPFAWPKALRLLAKYENSTGGTYSWNLTVICYEHPADEKGEYKEDRWQFVYRMGATLLDGQEVKGTMETAPLILSGILEQLFSDK